MHEDVYITSLRVIEAVANHVAEGQAKCIDIQKIIALLRKAKEPMAIKHLLGAFNALMRMQPKAEELLGLAERPQSSVSFLRCLTCFGGFSVFQ